MDLAGLKQPRGLDTSLIIPTTSRRRSTHTSPDWGNDNKPLPHTRSGKAGSSEVNPALAVATDPSGFQDVQTKGLILWDKLTSVKDPHSFTDPPRLLHTEFVRLPSKVDFPDYYNLIKKPVAFNDIWTKLERLEYSSIVEVRNDFNQCFVNAKRYNAPGSGIFLDAKKLHKVLKQWYAHITGEAEAPEDDDAPAPMPQPVYVSPPQPLQPLPLVQPPIPVNYVGVETVNAEAGPSTLLALPAAIPGTSFAKRGPTIKPWLTRKLAETTALVDANGRKFSDSFKSLPDKKEWAEYYKVITHPMSFDTVTTKVTKRAYTSVQQFIDDVNLIFANAQFFNEESSRIWTDARVMQIHFAEVMKEVPPTFIPPRKYNTAKRRAEAEALARGEVLPSSSSHKKRKITAAGESEPPEDLEGDGESGDEFEAEGSVPPSQGPTRAPSLAPTTTTNTAAVPQPQQPPPPTNTNPDPFNLPDLIKTEDSAPSDPFAIPGSLPTPSRGTTPNTNYPPTTADLTSNPQQPSPAATPNPHAPAGGGGYSNAPTPVDSPALGLGMGVGVNGGGEPSPPLMTNSGLANLDLGDPKLVARMRMGGVGGEEPSIARFLLQTHPPTSPLTLHNTPLTQHSLSLPPSTLRLDITPIFASPSPSLSSSVKLSVRPAGLVVEPLAELPGPGGVSHRYSVVLRRGLNVVEFVVGEKKEVFRCFVTKG
ncbi:hypothetical protein BCR35DRAFT_352732 [Leucosporidium creatinivorum]|uniref:Bromo domain-containing protein n=1 Tax=Leucosporidium creatinivorum TaxID=106004 RepID=A0A1Y2F7I5_9BASI|nr:hypothetical protein BCR35DRAFT_352732 [Leucosporidium creatinivorum]